MTDYTTRVRLGHWDLDACIFVLCVECWVERNGKWWRECPFRAGHEVAMLSTRRFLNAFGDRLPRLPSDAFGGVDVRPRAEPGRNRDHILHHWEHQQRTR